MLEANLSANVVCVAVNRCIFLGEISENQNKNKHTKKVSYNPYKT